MSRIAPGFPKLARYTGKTITLYFPRSYRDWCSLIREVKTNEVVVLVAKGYKGHYGVPIRLLEDSTIPISAIYRWTKSYTSFPVFYREDTHIFDAEWVAAEQAKSTITLPF